MIDKGDQQELYKNADAIKAAFYKVLKREKIASGVFADQSAQEQSVQELSDEQQEAQKVSEDPFSEIEKAFKEVYARYKESRAAYMQEIEKVKEENLAKKLEIIEKIKELLESTEDVNSTFPTFRELQNQWKSITLVPQANAKDLWESYQLYVEKFYDYIKSSGILISKRIWNLRHSFVKRLRLWRMNLM